jgi:hypothetical protein
LQALQTASQFAYSGLQKRLLPPNVRRNRNADIDKIIYFDKINMEKTVGTDLCKYGNHKINFNNRDYEDIARKIKVKLDTLQISNVEYLRFLVIYDLESSIKFFRRSSEAEILEKIKEYKGTIKKEWNYFITDYNDYKKDDEDDTYDNICKEITFRGLFDFELTFTYSSIYFWDSTFRFRNWFDINKNLRDEWRKYMYQIITLFGGDRVIYLPDQGADHFLDKFDQLPVISFDEIEKEIINEYGENEKTLENFTEEDSIWYYIDNFNDLEMNNKLSIDEYKKLYEGK